jgi:hypothetical protein
MKKLFSQPRLSIFTLSNPVHSAASIRFFFSNRKRSSLWLAQEIYLDEVLNISKQFVNI